MNAYQSPKRASLVGESATDQDDARMQSFHASVVKDEGEDRMQVTAGRQEQDLPEEGWAEQDDKANQHRFEALVNHEEEEAPLQPGRESQNRSPSNKSDDDE